MYVALWDLMRFVLNAEDFLKNNCAVFYETNNECFY